jgi:hypothetical protein
MSVSSQYAPASERVTAASLRKARARRASSMALQTDFAPQPGRCSVASRLRPSRLESRVHGFHVRASRSTSGGAASNSEGMETISTDSKARVMVARRGERPAPDHPISRPAPPSR